MNYKKRYQLPDLTTRSNKKCIENININIFSNMFGKIIRKKENYIKE